MNLDDLPKPCFVCGKKLERALPSESNELSNQPHDATMFGAYGNYGSTVWDPFPATVARKYLEINICDDCLVARADRVIRMTAIPRKHYEFAEWNPASDG